MTTSRPRRWCLPQTGVRSLEMRRLWPERLGWGECVGSEGCKDDVRVRSGGGDYEEVQMPSMTGKERPDVCG